MEEIIEKILERIGFKNKDLFKILLMKTVQVSNDSTKSTYAVHDNMIFRFGVFFKEFGPFLNEYGRDKQYLAGVEAIQVICEELGIEIEKQESFMLFHIRNIGKFRKREEDLLKELTPLWKTFPEFVLEGNEFSYAIKSLMRMKFISYRKGRINLNQQVIIRYKTGKS